MKELLMVFAQKVAKQLVPVPIQVGLLQEAEGWDNDSLEGSR